MVKVRPYRGSKTQWEVDIRFTWPDGSTYRARVKSPVPSKTGSQRWAEARERELLAQGPQATDMPTWQTLFDDFLVKHCEAERLKKSTVAQYKKIWRLYLKKYLANYKINLISQNDIQRIKGELTESFKPRTVNAVLVLLKLLLKKAVSWKIIPMNLVTSLSLKRQKTESIPSFYTTAEYAQLVKSAARLAVKGTKQTPAGAHLLALLLAGDAGLRSGEILGLTWDRIDFGKRYIVIDQAVWNGDVTSPKGTVGAVPMTRRLTEALRIYKNMQSVIPFNGLVFHTPDFKPLKPTRLHSWIQTVERNANMPQTRRVHKLRHTFVSHLVLKGLHPRVIQKLARHATLEMTLHYMHLADDQLEAARDKMDAWHGEMMELEKHTEAKAPKPIEFSDNSR